MDAKAKGERERNLASVAAERKKFVCLAEFERTFENCARLYIITSLAGPRGQPASQPVGRPV